jgi:hypothetical protein
VNKIPDKIDYTGLVQIWEWILKPMNGVTDFTKAYVDDTPSKSWSKVKSLFGKGDDDRESSKSIYPPEIQSVLDAVNERVVRQHVYQHVPFYTVLLREFIIHAQNHAKLESDRRDILEVFQLLQPTSSNRTVEFINEASRALKEGSTTPLRGVRVTVVEEADAIRRHVTQLEPEPFDHSIDGFKDEAIKLISVIKSVKTSTMTKAENIISTICNVFDIKDGGKSIPVYGQITPKKSDGEQEGDRIDVTKCYDDKGDLTDYGRALVRQGLLHRSIDDIGHRGSGPRPIKSDELLFMARLSHQLTDLIYRLIGIRYDLRFMASRQVWAFSLFALFVCGFFVFFLYLAITAGQRPLRVHYRPPPH